MGSYADAVDRMLVRAKSPDGNITGTMNGTTDGDLSFAEGTYQHYSERSLEHQLSMLAKLLMVGRRRAQRQALEEATGMKAGDENPKTAEPRRRRYLERWAELNSGGMSPRECFYLSATGMRDYRVVIKDGTLRQLSEAELISEIRGAITALLEDQDRNVQELHREIYETHTKRR